MDIKDYLKAHKASGIEVGDKVRMLRHPKSNEQGWNNKWVPVNYNGYVGEYYKVVSDRKEKGFRVESNNNHKFNLPWFVLEVVEKGNKVKIDDLDFGYLSKDTVNWITNAIIKSEPICFDNPSFVDYNVADVARKMRDLIDEIHDNGFEGYGYEIFELAYRINKAKKE